MVSVHFTLNLDDFVKEMIRRIEQSWPEKGISWRNMQKDRMVGLIQKYTERQDWVSVANIAFMLWENEQRERRGNVT